MPIIALALLIVALAACGSSSSSGGGSAATPTSGTRTGQLNTPINKWAVDYVHGKLGHANKALPPVVVGYVNQDTVLPGDTPGAEAAVKYINAELGGIGGHPLKLDKCIITSAEDGQRCAQKFANDSSIEFVIQGGMVVGNAAFHKTLALVGKPTMMAFATVPADYNAENSYTYTAGSDGITKGMVKFIGTHFKNPDRVAVIRSSNAAGVTSYNKIVHPGFEKLGIEVTQAAVPDTAGTSQLTAALQAAGADKADVIFAMFPVQSCIAMYDAMKSLGIEKPVVSLSTCYGTPMTEHLKDLGVEGQVPSGWYFAGYGYSYFAPDLESGMKTYMAKIKQYGPPSVNATGLAGPTFAITMTAAKFMNELGPENITSEKMNQKMKSFKGPMMMAAGPEACGTNETYPSVCGTTIGIEEYKDGKWLASALGENAIRVYGE